MSENAIRYKTTQEIPTWAFSKVISQSMTVAQSCSQLMVTATFLHFINGDGGCVSGDRCLSPRMTLAMSLDPL